MAEEDWYEDEEEEVEPEPVAEQRVKEPLHVVEIELEPEPKPQPFDYATLAGDFTEMANPNVTLIFPAENDEIDIIELAQQADDYKREEVEGRAWHICRFGKKNPDILRKLNRDLGLREEMVVLFNGKKTAFARTLWLPLMYIFGTSKPYY